MPVRVLLFTMLFTTPLVARAGDLFVLLQQRNCPDCLLADVDLVHADLRNADLQRAELQRANLDMRAWMALIQAVPISASQACAALRYEAQTSQEADFMALTLERQI